MTPAAAAASISALNRAVGRAVAWMTLAMVLVTFTVVVLRYWFDTGWIWVQETITWMHAAVFMLAAAYTLADDQHVRVDIFYRNMDSRRRALVNGLGTALFLLPVAVFLFWASWEYVSESWLIRETSREARGLVFPLPSIMKSFIPAMALLLLLQAVAMLLDSVAILAATDRPKRRATRTPP